MWGVVNVCGDKRTDPAICSYCSTGFNFKHHLVCRSILSLILILSNSYSYIRLYLFERLWLLSTCIMVYWYSTKRFFFVRSFIVVVTWWVWICSRYADLRMIKQVVVLMMIVSLIRLILCVSAVAIISPHLLLPIYSQLLFFSATYTLTICYMLLDCPTFLPHSHLCTLVLIFSVSLNDHFCVILITWSHFS